MKLIEKLAIWFLRKRKATVVIGLIVWEGEIQSKSKKAYLYDNVFVDATYYTYDDVPVDIPSGKFSVSEKEGE